MEVTAPPRERRLVRASAHRDLVAQRQDPGPVLQVVRSRRARRVRGGIGVGDAHVVARLEGEATILRAQAENTGQVHGRCVGARSGPGVARDCRPLVTPNRQLTGQCRGRRRPRGEWPVGVTEPVAPLDEHRELDVVEDIQELAAGKVVGGGGRALLDVEQLRLDARCVLALKVMKPPAAKPVRVPISKPGASGTLLNEENETPAMGPTTMRGFRAVAVVARAARAIRTAHQVPLGCMDPPSGKQECRAVG